MKWKRLTEKYFDVNTLKTAKGCWDWLGYRQSGGYGQTYMEGVRWTLHRLSWHFFMGEIPEGALVLHKCDRPCCINPEHLFLGSHKDNMHDCMSKGRHSFGFRKGHTYSSNKKRLRKLDDDSVRAIRQSAAPLADLALQYGVSMACISMLRNRKRKQLIAD